MITTPTECAISGAPIHEKSSKELEEGKRGLGAAASPEADPSAAAVMASKRDSAANICALTAMQEWVDGNPYSNIKCFESRCTSFEFTIEGRGEHQ